MTVGLRVTYYESDKAALLGECLVPAARRAAALPGVTAAWLHLHWRLGPHCVLYLDGEDAAVAAAAAGTESAARAFLERRPSAADLEPGRYAAFSERMGRLELVEVHLPPGARVSFPAEAYAFTHHQIWVLEGDLEFREGETVHGLGAGDCLQTGPPAPCEFHNPGGRECRYLVAVTRRAP